MLGGQRANKDESLKLLREPPAKQVLEGHVRKEDQELLYTLLCRLQGAGRSIITVMRAFVIKLIFIWLVGCADRKKECALINSLQNTLNSWLS